MFNSENYSYRDVNVSKNSIYCSVGQFISIEVDLKESASLCMHVE